MRYLIELSGESEELARAEALAVCSDGGDEERPYKDGRAMAINSDIPGKDIVSRLALAWSVSEHRFSCRTEELDGELEKLELPGETFRVRASRISKVHSPEDGAALSRKAGGILSKRYRVDLDGPETEVRILMSGKMHVGILCGEIDRSAIEARKPENRPYKHPISLHPKLARALVNLTRVRSGDTVLDPFCGTGGILLEAGLMGCGTVGGDMDARMVDGSILNLTHFGINTDIRQLDISDWPESHAPVDAIATDPPYGRSASTAKEPIESLYKRAFATCHAMLKDGGRLAIALPDERHIKLAEGFELEGMYPVRVHRSLTRHFCVLRK